MKSENILYPLETRNLANFCGEKINLQVSDASEKFLDAFFESNGTRNIFKTYL